MAAVPTRTIGYDASAPRQAIIVTLNSDLLNRVAVVTPNLSATVETLLSEYLAKRTQSHDPEHDQNDDVIEAINRFHGQNGFLSDEFSKL